MAASPECGTTPPAAEAEQPTAPAKGALPTLLNTAVPDGSTCKGHSGGQAAEQGSAAVAKAGSAAPSPPRYMYFIAGCAALNSINLGYDVGVSSGVGVYIREEFELEELQVGLFFGVLHFVAAAGGLWSQAVSDRLGRVRTFTVAQVICVAGIALVAGSGSFAVLMAGRVLVGVGVGVGLSIDPLYIAEAAPAAHRGMLTTWSELAINVGIVLGFVANWALAPLPAGVNWRVMVAIGAVLPCALLVLSLAAMPESPRWLAMRGRAAEAAAVLRRTHPAGEDVAALLQEMQAEIEADQEQARAGWAALLWPEPGTWRPVLVGLGVAVAQQVNASESVVFYSPTIFERSGVATSRQALFAATILVGFVKMGFVAVSGCLLDRVGRRPLLLLSLSAVAASLALLALGSRLAQSWLAVLATLCFMAAFSLGVGPETWLLVAELFPSRVRAKAMSLAVFLNRMTSGAVALTFLPLSKALGGQANYFAAFAVVTAGTALAAGWLVPETKGRSLEQTGGRPARARQACGEA